MSGTKSENDPAAFELFPGDGALSWHSWSTWAALAVARPGLALTEKQRLFLGGTPSVRGLHQMADRLSKLAWAIKTQRPADTCEPDG